MLKKASFQNVTNFRDRDCDRDSRMAIAIVTAIDFSGRRSWLRLWLEVLWLRLRLWLWLALFFMTVCTLKHRLWLWLKWWLWPSRNANFLWLRFRWLHDRFIISHNRDQFFSSPGSKLSNFESENLIGWKRSSNFISLHLAYRKCNKRTKLRSFLAYFTRQKQFFQKTLKISAPNSFFQKMPKFFYLILDFFNKFY